MMPRFSIVIFIACLIPHTAFGNSMLVDTAWLASKLGAKNIAVVDMSDSIQYSRFHIPGARHLPYNAITRPNRKRVSLSIGSQGVTRILGQLGITADMHIIIYDDIGGLNASRLFWELERLGHQKMSLLDGGLVKWILEGKKVVAEQAHYPATTYTQAAAKGRDNLAALDDISQTKQSNSILLDVRSKEEYLGHPRQKVSGHIPGARWWHWEDNVNFDKAFQLQTEEKLLKAASVVGLDNKQQDIILYCQSGHRAAHSYF